MRKLLFMFAIAMTAIVVTSCKSQSTATNGNETKSTELIYNVTANATGDVEFSWFNGSAVVTGETTITQCNDNDAKLFMGTRGINNGIKTLEQGLKSNDVDTVKTAKILNDMITIKGVEGKYHLSIKGYVKYGPMIFQVDEEYPKN